jgi:hypothetical protein
MRFKEVDFPQRLLDAQGSNSLVVFAGAGVSMSPPSNFPGFEGLAQNITAGVLERESAEEPMERFLGRAEARGVRVHEVARDILSDSSSEPNLLHNELLKLFPDSAKVRLVTTNFDAHFSTVAVKVFESDVTHYYAPALPVGDRFDGIVYLHGSVEREPERIVLTDSDFGRAYLTEGWARRFLQAMFTKYTVLFVGYSHEDAVMNYLARGLPPDTQGLRFALVDSEQDPERWKFRGIAPITYPVREGPEKYSALGEAITAWVTRTRMGTLDHERQIQELVASAPPLDPEMADYIAVAVKEPVKVRFFVRHAKSPEWLRWADDQQAFDGLFQQVRSVDYLAREMAYWFADNFVVEYPEEALALVQRHGQRLNPTLWYAIAQKLASADARPEPQVLARWVTFLLSSPPLDDTRMLLDVQLKACRYPEDSISAILLFEYLTRPLPRLKRTFSSEGTVVRPEIEVEGCVYVLKEVWQEFFRPNLGQFADKLERIVVSHLQQASLILRSVGQATDRWDPLSFGRSAIEPHEQDFRYTGMDVLIDATRDILEWTLAHEPQHARNMIEEWVESDILLLRRLAVHGITQS